MHRVIFYISNTLIKLIIRAWEIVFRCVGLGLEKKKIVVNHEVRKFSMVKVIPVL